MLANRNIIITGASVVGDVAIAKFIANIDLDKNDISFSTQQIDKEACKQYRENVREDHAEFEDLAYSIQDDAEGYKEKEV